MQEKLTRPQKLLITSRYGKEMIKDLLEFDPEIKVHSELPWRILFTNILIKEWSAPRRGALTITFKDKCRIAYNPRERYFYRISEDRVKELLEP